MLLPNSRVGEKYVESIFTVSVDIERGSLCQSEGSDEVNKFSLLIRRIIGEGSHFHKQG